MKRKKSSKKRANIKLKSIVKTKTKEEKSIFKKISFFLFESNSILSWIACLLLCFLIIRFGFFPLASLAFSTSLPFVVVETESMEHNVNFSMWWEGYDAFYESKNISKDEFLSWSFSDGFDKGDIMIIKGYKEYEIGDVVVFKIEGRTPIIHRIVSLNPISTKGDNNKGQLSIEESISEGQVVGKAIARIPKLGYLKLFFVKNILKQ